METSNDQPHHHHQTSPSSSSLPSHEDVCKSLFGHHRDSMYRLFERFYGRMAVECPDPDMDKIKKAVQNGDKKEALQTMNHLFKAHTASGDLHRLNAEIHAKVVTDCLRGDLTIDQHLLAQHMKKGINSAARSVALSPANIDNHYVLVSLLSLDARDTPQGRKLVIQKCKEALEIHDSEETKTKFWKFLEGEIFRRKEFILESFIKRYFLKIAFSDLISFVSDESDKAFLQQCWDFVKSNISWKFWMCCCCEEKFDSSNLLFKHLLNTHLTPQAKLVIVSGILGNKYASSTSERVHTHETLVLPHAMSEDLIVNANCLNTGTSHSFPSLDNSITNTSYQSEIKQWQEARERGRQKGAALLLAMDDMSGVDASAQGLLVEALERLSRAIDAEIKLCNVWIFPFPYHKNKENQLAITRNPFNEYNFSEVILPTVKSYISAWFKAETHLDLSIATTVHHHTSDSLQPHHQQEPTSDFGEEAMQLLNAAFKRMWEAHYATAVSYYGLGHVVVDQYDFFEHSGATLDTEAIHNIMSIIEGRENDNAPADFYRIQAEYYKDCAEIIGDDITTDEVVLKGTELAREAVRRSPNDIRNHSVLISLLSLDGTLDDRRRHDNILAQCHHALLINKSSDGEDERFETARSHVTWFLCDITRFNRVQANWASMIVGSHIAVPICTFEEFCRRTFDNDVLQLVIKALKYGNSKRDWKFWQCCCCPMEFTSSMDLYNHIPSHLTPEAKIALSSGICSSGWCPSTSENDDGTGFIRIDTVLSRLLINPTCLIDVSRRSTSATNLPFQDLKISKLSYKSELMEWASLRQSRERNGTRFIKALENIYISGVEEGNVGASVALRDASASMDYSAHCKIVWSFNNEAFGINPFGAYDYTDALLPLLKSCIADMMEKEADEEALLAFEGSGNE